MIEKFQVKDEKMSKYKTLVERLIKLFKKVEFEKISRLDNEAADELTKLASSIRSTWERKVSVHSIPGSSTSRKFEVICLEENPTLSSDIAS